MFDFSTLQQLFGGGLGQGLLGQQPQMGGQQPPQMGQQNGGMPGYGPNVGNTYAMGIPTQPQATAPYQQYSPYTQGGSPYTQTGWTPSFQDYFSPFQDLRQELQDKNNADYTAAQQPQVPQQPAPIDPCGYMAGGWGDAPHWVVGPKPANYDSPQQQWYRSQSG